jgi:hypothetical protein
LLHRYGFTVKPRIFVRRPTEYAPHRARLGVFFARALRGAFGEERWVALLFVLIRRGESATMNPMKKRLFWIPIILSCLASHGCKPKETAPVESKPKLTILSGQVFIVQRDSENIKLGLVEVRLIDRQKVADFFRAKEQEIASEQLALSNNLEAAETEFEAASNEYRLLHTDTNYLKAISDLAEAFKDYSDATNLQHSLLLEVFAKEAKVKELAKQLFFCKLIFRHNWLAG